MYDKKDENGRFAAVRRNICHGVRLPADSDREVGNENGIRIVHLFDFLLDQAW